MNYQVFEDQILDRFIRAPQGMATICDLHTWMAGQYDGLTDASVQSLDYLKGQDEPRNPNLSPLNQAVKRSIANLKDRGLITDKFISRFGPYMWELTEKGRSYRSADQ